MNLSRADTSGFARWWWTIDRVSLTAVLGLMAIGLLLAFAASPAATDHGSAAGNFSYAIKQLGFAATALGIMIGASFLNYRQTRMVAAAVFALAWVGAVMALLIGPRNKPIDWRTPIVNAKLPAAASSTTQIAQWRPAGGVAGRVWVGCCSGMVFSGRQRCQQFK